MAAHTTHGSAVPTMLENSARVLSVMEGDGEEASAAGTARRTRAAVECGWGRFIPANTYDDAADVAAALQQEEEGRRDVAFYVSDPHVALASAPHALFLDPSHSYRLDLSRWQAEPREAAPGLRVRRAAARDEAAANRLYLGRGMVPVKHGFFQTLEDRPDLTILVAEQVGDDHTVIGVAMGVDHALAYGDPDQGASLWALAVDPQAQMPGIGEALVVELAGRFAAAGRRHMDLSVMHDNSQAIALYEKLGFERIAEYSVKRKNVINEKLFVGPQPGEDLNIYAQIIVDEALRRGITVEVEDAAAGLFRLSLGGRAVSCRESLSDLTTAVALSRCDDKRLTRRLLKRHGLSVPDQIIAHSDEQCTAFLEEHGSVVVKPARGEMGRGVSVDLRTPEEMYAAITRAREQCDDVIVEETVEGSDLRLIVIDDELVAAAVRRPATVIGDGHHTVVELIDKQSRRRKAATAGESSIPLDEETERCVLAQGYQMLDVPEEGATIPVRKTANLHTGGTIHDVTDDLHPDLAEVAVKAARALSIPVVGFDLIVADPSEPHYKFIEANERPGLANHEPQPTAERFIDCLFPNTRADHAPGGSPA